MEKYIACKKCGFKMNTDFPLFPLKDLKKHEGLCNLCWNKKYEKEKGKAYRAKKDNEKKRSKQIRR